jgi:hypothetical protein
MKQFLKVIGALALIVIGLGFVVHLTPSSPAPLVTGPKTCAEAEDNFEQAAHASPDVVLSARAIEQWQKLAYDEWVQACADERREEDAHPINTSTVLERLSNAVMSSGRRSCLPQRYVEGHEPSTWYVECQARRRPWPVYFVRHYVTNDTWSVAPAKWPAEKKGR